MAEARTYNVQNVLNGHPSASLELNLKIALAFEKGFKGYKAGVIKVEEEGKSFYFPFVTIASKIKTAESLPFSWHSELNIDSDTNAKEVIAAIKKELKASVIMFSSMTHLNSKLHEALIASGFEYEEKQSDILELRSQSFDEIFASRFSVKVRNQCRKALKSGMTIGLKKSEQSVEEYYKLYVEATQTWGKKTPPYEKAFFKELILNNEEVDFWVAELDEKFLGGVIVIKYDGWLYYWSGMINREFSSLCINNGLLHEALKFYSATKQYDYFNFGPSETLGSVKKFKESWGTSSFLHHHYIWKSTGYKTVYKPLQKLKSILKK